MPPAHSQTISSILSAEQPENGAHPHPPCSPDLAPPDFYVFGHVKEFLAGLSLESADELLEAIKLKQGLLKNRILFALC
jgi:hypothetical protein